ncbi:hypothetical protein J2T15_000041 [Paenibacillus harenae]|uniref:Uncharacterized protein n=1 Tax=Paenibacillus harenae TaxID=306543 RepID=A0ABT9TTE8_PAEHA|nr:hypothetical protein [Paenibacillus harenae]MDQ0110625.1 hypothetical protein [Paenibacillus harenae]
MLARGNNNQLVVPQARAARGLFRREKVIEREEIGAE